MSYSRRRLLKDGARAAAGVMLGRLPGARSLLGRTGPFDANWGSLANYRCPEWFRDAKFGMWAHWTAQCVPEQGDWYARSMYIEGSDDYKFHCQTYGHPSVFGFKDIDHIWRAENWDPEHLIGLYKAAGAKYFVALANHHDNFDCFDSTHQPWNSVKIGPKKDIVGSWGKVAREHGLRFGVTSHASHAWNWFEVAQGADKAGPYAGVPYDGRMSAADGKGLWWDGLDPVNDLYAQNHVPGKTMDWEFDASKGSSVPDAAYIEKFYRRIEELIDKYDPDLLYFDDTVLPIYPVSNVGLRIAAHYYNASLARHGRLEAVLTGKWLNEDQKRCLVNDFERGRSDTIEPLPWQTDTCIGNWHYQRSLYENHQYKSAKQVVRMLVDIVSKNGNLLLNVPVRGDGTIDPDEMKFLSDFTPWMQTNHEAIYGTRPWIKAGEGPVKVKGGGFSEGGEDQFTSRDFRFTKKGHTLYAVAFGWPTDGILTVKSLAAGSDGVKGEVRRVSLLGSHERLTFTRDSEGLAVTMPEQQVGDYAFALKIEGLDLS